MCPPPQVASEGQKSRLLTRAATLVTGKSESSLLTAALAKQPLQSTRLIEYPEFTALLRCKHETGQISQLRDESLLEIGVECFRCGLLLSAVMPISTAHFRGWLVAHRKPGLREMSHLEIVRRAAIPGRSAG